MFSEKAKEGTGQRRSLNKHCQDQKGCLVPLGRAQQKEKTMIEIRRRHVGVLCGLTLLLGAASLARTAKAQDATKSFAQEPSPSPLKGGEKWQEGEACVKSQAPDCPSKYRGVCRTGRADGCTHEACTNAKTQARLNLVSYLEGEGVKDQCAKYIQATAPCKKGSGCK